MGAVLDAFVQNDAVYMDKHFVLKSGKHSDRYINPDGIMPHPSVVDRITYLMAEPFTHQVVTDHFVCIGPAFGGNYLARDVARNLSDLSERELLWVATRKQSDGSFVIEPDRGFGDWLEDATVLIVEDLLTTGGSVGRLLEALRPWGVTPIGVTAAINRGGVTAETLGVPRLVSAEEIEVETDEPRVCRWCALERPIVEDMGHGAEYKETHPNYEGGYVALLG
jgi:orotate phosphoribosyltransferase